jgi:hypothetical protein
LRRSQYGVNDFILELFHGPTSLDLAMQLLAG